MGSIVEADPLFRNAFTREAEFLPYGELVSVLPTFPLDITPLDHSLHATVILPVSHAVRPLEALSIHAISESKASVSLTPFQIEDKYQAQARHPIGGVIIGFEGKDRLMLFSLEYRESEHPFRRAGQPLNVYAEIYLCKIDQNDTGIRVQHRTNTRSYVLKNDFRKPESPRAESGLWIENVRHLNFLQTGDDILVLRD